MLVFFRNFLKTRTLNPLISVWCGVLLNLSLEAFFLTSSVDALKVIKAIKGGIDWSISSFVQGIMKLFKSFCFG